MMIGLFDKLCEIMTSPHYTCRLDGYLKESDKPLHTQITSHDSPHYTSRLWGVYKGIW